MLWNHTLHPRVPALLTLTQGMVRATARVACWISHTQLMGPRRARQLTQQAGTESPLSPRSAHTDTCTLGLTFCTIALRQTTSFALAPGSSRLCLA